MSYSGSVQRLSGVPHSVVRFPPPRTVVESAAAQGLDIAQVTKAIIVRRGEDDYVFVLVPGDRVIDWKKLRRVLGVRRLSLPERDEAEDATGYVPGTITPFDARHRWPVIADERLADQELVAIGAGERGVTIHLSGADLVRVLDAEVADVTRNPQES